MERGMHSALFYWDVGSNNIVILSGIMAKIIAAFFEWQPIGFDGLASVICMISTVFESSGNDLILATAHWVCGFRLVLDELTRMVTFLVFGLILTSLSIQLFRVGELNKLSSTIFASSMFLASGIDAKLTVYWIFRGCRLMFTRLSYTDRLMVIIEMQDFVCLQKIRLNFCLKSGWQA
jgi:hypothetical protein